MVTILYSILPVLYCDTVDQKGSAVFLLFQSCFASFLCIMIRSGAPSAVATARAALCLGSLGHTSSVVHLERTRRTIGWRHTRHETHLTSTAHWPLADRDTTRTRPPETASPAHHPLRSTPPLDRRQRSASHLTLQGHQQRARYSGIHTLASPRVRPCTHMSVTHLSKLHHLP